MKDKLITTLQDFGLSDKEAQVYLAMLPLGETTILEIARRCDVKRTTVYPVINTLQNKGLVHEVERGFKRFLKAENPERLELVFEQRKKNLVQSLPHFLGLYTQGINESSIQELKGLEAIKQGYDSMLETIKPGDNYYVIGDYKDWYEPDPEFFEDFSYRRGKLPINIRLIMIDSPITRMFKSREAYYNFKIRLLPDDTHFSTNIVFHPQRFFAHQLSYPIQGYILENKSLIKTMSELFEVMWRGARED